MIETYLMCQLVVGMGERVTLYCPGIPEGTPQVRVVNQSDYSITPLKPSGPRHLNQLLIPSLAEMRKVTEEQIRINKVGN